MLLKKAYECLDNKEKDAYILIFDYFLYDESKRPAPFAIALLMRTFSNGSQFTFGEIEDMMKDVGFSDFQEHKLSGYADVLIGVKKASK